MFHAYRPEEMSEYHDEQKSRSVNIFTEALRDHLDSLGDLSGSVQVCLTRSVMSRLSLFLCIASASSPKMRIG